uniref:Cyclin-L1 n=1 Tax=Schistocephalus solidus TaxID=70667 RepID=A0A0X3NTW1_SCHSO
MLKDKAEIARLCFSTLLVLDIVCFAKTLLSPVRSRYSAVVFTGPDFTLNEVIFLPHVRNYMNDVLRTDVFVRYFPEAVACACIFLAARKLGIPLPRYPPWWEMFNVDEESVHEIALCLQRLYVRSKPDVSALELRLAEIRKKQAEAREVALASSAASRSLNSRPLDDASSGNPSPSKAPVDNSKPDGSSRAAAVSPTSTAKPDPSLNLNTLAAHLSDLKGSRSRRSPEENRKPATDINLLNGGVQPGLKEDPDDISHQKSEKRRPSAYSEIDSKGRKRKTRCRSRSPMSRKGHVRSHRRRHSSSTNSDESYDSRSPPPRVHYSRSQEKGSRHSGYDYRKKSPASSDKYKSYKKHKSSRHRSHSDSSLSTTPSPPERSSRLPRNKSPPSRPTAAYRTDYDKVSSDLDFANRSKSSSKTVNGVSGQPTKSSKQSYVGSSRSRARQ